jgi:hypothetical protein
MNSNGKILAGVIIALALLISPNRWTQNIAHWLGAQSFFLQVDVETVEDSGGDEISDVESGSENVQGVFPTEDESAPDSGGGDGDGDGDGDEGGDGEHGSAPILTATPTSSTLYPNQTIQLTAIYNDGSPNNVSNSALWNSTAPSIASVNNAGLVTAITPGNASITAIYNAELSNNVNITVQPEIGTFKVKPNLRGAHPLGGQDNFSTVVSIQFRNPESGELIANRTGLRTSDQGYGFETLPPDGIYDVIIDGISQLRKVYRNITVTDGVATDFTNGNTAYLQFGEVGAVRDGVVTISDLTAITAPIIAQSPNTPQYARPHFSNGTETLSVNDQLLEKVDANADGAITIADITGAIAPLINNAKADTY